MKGKQVIYIVIVVILLGSSAVIAYARANAGPGIVSPNSKVQGLTYGEWSAKWWQYVLSIPTPENPLTGGTGDRCVFERIGNVGLVAVNPTLGAPIYCEVPAGMMLFLDIVSAECSNLEPEPFHGEDETQMRACATGFTLADLQASIDGQAVKNLKKYIHTSPIFEFSMPADNILGTETLIGQSVSNGAHLILSPLSPGEHQVMLHANVPELDYTVDMDMRFTVTK